jgi:hypothetical protein
MYRGERDQKQMQKSCRQEYDALWRALQGFAMARGASIVVSSRSHLQKPRD